MSLEELAAIQPVENLGGELFPVGCDNRFLDEVFRISREIFGFQPTTEVVCDPDNPEFSWTVVNVEARGEPKELVKRQVLWHTRVALLDTNHSLRLSILPVK